jgi:invasion protein IalB
LCAGCIRRRDVHDVIRLGGAPGLQLADWRDLTVDLAQIRANSHGAFAAWFLAVLLGLTAPAPALAQATQGAPSPGTPGQAPAGQPPKGQPTTPPPASPRDGKQFQDWTLHCRPASEGKPEACEMHQAVVNKKGNRVLLAVVGRVPNMDTPGMLILLPLGIALQPGAFLRIDDGQRQPLEIKLCERQGCRIEMLLKPDLLAKLKAGTKMTVTFYFYDNQGKEPQADVPVSLLGFSAALAEVLK